MHREWAGFLHTGPSHGRPRASMERRSEVHAAHADVGRRLQHTRVPNSQPPFQMAAQGGCCGCPTTENHSVAYHGPGPGQRPRSHMAPPHERFFHGFSRMMRSGQSASLHAPRRDRVSHGTRFLAPSSLARRRLGCWLDAERSPRPSNMHRRATATRLLLLLFWAGIVHKLIAPPPCLAGRYHHHTFLHRRPSE